MNKETFEKAQDLNMKIEQIEQSINKIREGKCRIEIDLYDDEEIEWLNDCVIRLLRIRKGELRKKFNALK